MVLWAGLRLNGAPEARGWSAAPITVVFTVTAARLPGFIHSFFFIHEGSEAWLKAMEIDTESRDTKQQPKPVMNTILFR